MVENNGSSNTSMGVSLLSAAATSVSMFKAEPNPVIKTKDCCIRACKNVNFYGRL